MEHKSYFGPMVMRASCFCLIFLGPLPFWGGGSIEETWEMVSTQTLSKARCQSVDAWVKNRLFGVGLRQLLADHLVAPRVLEADKC